MVQRKTATVIRQLGLSQTLAHMADQKAARLGLSTPEYIRYLIVQDKPSPKEFISPEAEKRYFKDLIEFLKSEVKNPTQGYTSAEELIRHLEKV